MDISDEALPYAVREAVRHRHPLLLVLDRPDPAIAAEELVVRTALNLLRHAPYPLLLAVDGQPFALRPHQDLLRQLLLTIQGTLDVLHVTVDGEDTPGSTVLLGTVRDSDLVDALAESSLHQVY